MSETAWLAFAAGLLLGGLAVLVWRVRREQGLRIETELLRARIGSETAAEIGRAHV